MDKTLLPYDTIVKAAKGELESIEDFIEEHGYYPTGKEMDSNPMQLSCEEWMERFKVLYAGQELHNLF